MTLKVTPQELLSMPLPENDAGAETVRDYLVALLAEVWREEEGFSGKRPFGNSSWQEIDIYGPMADAGIIGDRYDDRREGQELVLAAIKALGEPATTGTTPGTTE